MTDFGKIPILVILCTGIFGFSNLFSQEECKIHLVGQPEESSHDIVASEIMGDDGRVYRDIAGLIILSNTDSLRFYSDKKIVKVDSRAGYDMLFLYEYAKTLVIYRNGCDSLRIDLAKYQVSLNRKKVWRISIKLDRQKMFRVKFLTNPPDARVMLNNTDIGLDRHTVVPEGKYPVSVEKLGYFRLLDTIYVDQNRISFAYNLKLRIAFRVIPSDARIYVDNVEIITGTFRGITLGVHNFLAKKQGFQSFHKQIEIKGDKAVLELKLRRENLSVLVPNFAAGLKLSHDLGQSIADSLIFSPHYGIGVSVPLVYLINQIYFLGSATLGSGVVRFERNSLSLRKDLYHARFGLAVHRNFFDTGKGLFIQFGYVYQIMYFMPPNDTRSVRISWHGVKIGAGVELKSGAHSSMQFELAYNLYKRNGIDEGVARNLGNIGSFINNFSVSMIFNFRSLY